MNEFMDCTAQQRVDEVHWYRGTADAIYPERRHHP